MKRTIQSVVAQAIRQGLKEYSLIILSSVGFLILFVYLGLNIFFSQNISDLYGGVANDDVFAVTEFLKKIKPLPEFKFFFEMQKRAYGESLLDAVYKEELQKRQKIRELESALQKNKNSRDVLYGLYILYNELGENEKAEEYLKRAKEIDPLVHIPN